MAYKYPYIEPQPGVSPEDWADWRWQYKNALKSKEDFGRYFDLTDDEIRGFEGADRVFQVRSTPYYAALAKNTSLEVPSLDPIRRTLMPSAAELEMGHQQMLDPLGEKRNNPAPRIIHRYKDRCLFLVTDFCSVYCRYCTRKHFTAQDQVFPKSEDYEKSLQYIRTNPQIKEVILSGGDPLTLSNGKIEKVLRDIRSIEHVDIIRVGSRIPVVAPMRIDQELVDLFKAYGPVFFMSHFGHPRELTAQAADALTMLVDGGIPVFNQFVLLNGINNHPDIVRALSRRLLYLRVKPYYMFQCDPSEGSDHLRTSVENSLWIQKELWGHTSGLAMPNLSLDIPDGGGKAGLVPEFQTSQEGRTRNYTGFDGVKASYVSPPDSSLYIPADAHLWAE